MGGLLMVYDTETSDKRHWDAKYNDPRQPNLLQIGYKIYDPASRIVVFEVGHLVDTTLFAEWMGINPDAQAIHGIREEALRTYGAPPKDTITSFQSWAERCSYFVAHNESFDHTIMQCFAYRAGFSPDLFSTGRTFCTMKSTVSFCKIPSKNGVGYKWPKLSEAYGAIVDSRGFKHSHDALSDVNACAEILWKLIDAELLIFKDGEIVAKNIQPQ